ncbi:MAG TPA: hypothetical protein VKX49_10450 [Bryobacteraceae bacterium]|nr:hypothetical protein [Bryobacteraceae bacterium]
MLVAAAGGSLASALLLLLVPRIGTLFLEILAGLVMLGRALVVRRREHAAAQLCLNLPVTANRIRLPDRYELVLLIIVILAYGTVISTLRSVRAPEILTRTVPLLLFAVGLLAKTQIIRAITACTDLLISHLGRGQHEHSAEETR